MTTCNESCGIKLVPGTLALIDRAAKRASQGRAQRLRALILRALEAHGGAARRARKTA